MPKCETCGQVLKNAFAMKIHVGRMHKEAGATPAAGPDAAGGLDVRALVVDELISLKQQVDRRLASIAERLHLAGVVWPQPVKKANAPTLGATVRRGLDRARAAGKPLADYVRDVLAKAEKGLRIKEIEARVLAAGYPTKAKSIYSQVMTVVGKGFQRVERGVYTLGAAAKAGTKAAQAVMAAPPAPATRKSAASKPRERGVFKESAAEMILGLLQGGRPVSSTEIAAAWKRAGRKGKPSKTLSDMVKAKKIKRQILKGTRANNYTLA